MERSLESRLAVVMESEEKFRDPGSAGEVLAPH